MAAEQWERRQGMRVRGGWSWSIWLPCTEAEARRVTGLHSWEVRRVCVCATCGGTGRMPAGVLEAEAPSWRAMVYAPRDGTEVELLLHHPNWQYAKDDNAQWQQIVRAKWIDFNHGGWTWDGMYGTPQGWRPAGVDLPDGAKR